MNKPKLNETKAGVTVRYSHQDKGHWIEREGLVMFVKTRNQALKVFEEQVSYQFRRGLRAV